MIESLTQIPNSFVCLFKLSKFLRLVALGIFASLFFSFNVSAQLKTMVNEKDGLRYVRIPAGSFLMGCVPGDKFCQIEEKPQHKGVITRDFWLSQTETTVGAFRKFIKEAGYVPSSVKKNQGRIYLNSINDWQWTNGVTWETPLAANQKAPDDFPVAQVSWDDAAAFCKFAGGRLPSEAEWEYAARGGINNQLYPWGNEETPMKNGIRQSNAPDETTARMFPGMKTFQNYTDGFAIYAPVKSFAPNNFGLYDMAGNVWEWTNDFFGDKPFGGKTETNPIGALTGDAKIVRGGSWAYSPEQQRSSERGYFEHKNFWTASLGFRCVVAAPAKKAKSN